MSEVVAKLHQATEYAEQAHEFDRRKGGHSEQVFEKLKLVREAMQEVWQSMTRYTIDNMAKCPKESWCIRGPNHRGRCDDGVPY